MGEETVGEKEKIARYIQLFSGIFFLNSFFIRNVPSPYKPLFQQTLQDKLSENVAGKGKKKC